MDGSCCDGNHNGENKNPPSPREKRLSGLRFRGAGTILFVLF